MVAGLLSFATVDADTGRGQAIPRMIVITLGLGITLPLLNVVVQNAVPFQVVGVATASVQFFRQIGGTLGVALLTGVMLNNYRSGLDDVASGLPAVLDNPSALLNESEVAGLQARYEATAAAGDPASRSCSPPPASRSPTRSRSSSSSRRDRRALDRGRHCASGARAATLLARRAGAPRGGRARRRRRGGGRAARRHSRRRPAEPAQPPLIERALPPVAPPPIADG